MCGQQKGALFKWNSCIEDFEELWLRLISELAKDDVEKVVAIMHSIWGRRNLVVFDSSFSSPDCVVQRALVNLSDFHEVTKKGGNEGTGSEHALQREKWKVPDVNSVKVNFDATMDLQAQKMGIGVVIRDFRGDILASLSAQKIFVNSPFVAECHALWRAVDLCRELGFDNACFEGDAKVVVDAVNADSDDDSWKGQLVADLRFAIEACRGWSLQFIHREGNELAHSLAKLGLIFDNEIVWMECVPPECIQKVVHDKLCNQLNNE